MDNGAKSIRRAGTKVVDTVLGRPRVRFEIDTAWIKGLLMDKFGDRGWGLQAAKLMEVDPTTLSRLVNDGRQWMPHTVLRYQNIVRRPLEEIMARLAPGVPIIAADESVRVAGHVGIDGIVHPGTSIGVRRVAGPPGLIDAQALTVVAPGTSVDGWALYYGAPASRIETMLGYLCVVRRQVLNDVRVGVLRKGSGTGLFGLTGFAGINPPYEESRLIDAAPVVWIKMA